MSLDSARNFQSFLKLRNMTHNVVIVRIRFVQQQHFNHFGVTPVTSQNDSRVVGLGRLRSEKKCKKGTYVILVMEVSPCLQ